MLNHRAKPALRLGSDRRCFWFKPLPQFDEIWRPFDGGELLRGLIEPEQVELPFPVPSGEKAIFYESGEGCCCFPSFDALAKRVPVLPTNVIGIHSDAKAGAIDLLIEFFQEGARAVTQVSLHRLAFTLAD